MKRESGPKHASKNVGLDYSKPMDTKLPLPSLKEGDHTVIFILREGESEASPYIPLYPSVAEDPYAGNIGVFVDDLPDGFEEKLKDNTQENPFVIQHDRAVVVLRTVIGAPTEQGGPAGQYFILRSLEDYAENRNPKPLLSDWLAETGKMALIKGKVRFVRG